MLARGRGKHLAPRVHDQRLGAAGANVNAQIISHDRTFLVVDGLSFNQHHRRNARPARTPNVHH